MYICILFTCVKLGESSFPLLQLLYIFTIIIHVYVLYLCFYNLAGAMSKQVGEGWLIRSLRSHVRLMWSWGGRGCRYSIAVFWPASFPFLYQTAF